MLIVYSLSLGTGSYENLHHIISMYLRVDVEKCCLWRWHAITIYQNIIIIMYLNVVNITSKERMRGPNWAPQAVSEKFHLVSLDLPHSSLNMICVRKMKSDFWTRRLWRSMGIRLLETSPPTHGHFAQSPKWKRCQILYKYLYNFLFFLHLFLNQRDGLKFWGLGPQEYL